MKRSLTPEPETYSSVGASINALASDIRPVSLWSVCVLSLLLHLLLVGLLVGTFLLLQFLGFHIPLFEPLAMKSRDIEFVLVENPEAPPRDKKTKNRAEHATRSGGQKIKHMAQAEPQQSAGQTAQTKRPQPAQRQQTAQRTPSPQPARQPSKQQPRPQPQPRPVQRPQPQPQPTQAMTPPEPKKVAMAAPPSPKLPTPKAPSNQSPIMPPNPIAPTIKTPVAPEPKSIASGPIVNVPGMGNSSGGSSGTKTNVGPSQIPGGVSAPSNPGGGSPGGGRSGQPGAGSPGSRAGRGGRGSNDQVGSPGGGGGRPGIDAMPEPDFGPYIAELQRRIKRNWTPPSDDRDKRIVAMFTIARDGRLLSLRIQNSSGVKVADEAALNAIRASAPFRQLPPNFRGNDIDVQFIFDYNVYRGKSSGITYSR